MFKTSLEVNKFLQNHASNGMKKYVSQPDNKPYYSTSSCNFAKHAEALNHGLQILHMKWSVTLFYCFLHPIITPKTSA